MSRSSVPERDATPPADLGGPADRGQVDPLPALLAVAVVGLALSLYAGVLPRATTDDEADETAAVTLGTVCERICDGGRVDPESLARGLAAAPDGYRLRVVLRADGREWTAGPAPPDAAATAERAVTVALAPGETVPGRLRVAVWR